MKFCPKIVISLSTFVLPFLAKAEPKDEIYQTGFLSIEDAQKSIELPDGYSLELVLSEPQIEEPVALAWDGNGVLYVVEMRTYMQDIDAGGEQEPRSRISRHEDTNGDGVYDKHTVFIDDLLLPRMVLPLDDRVMVGVTNTLDLWNYRDTTGDGKADEKVKIFEGGPRGGNMEHQPSGLIWNVDNWIYLTYQATRYRFTKDGEFKTEKLPRGGGQWGLTHDDDGRIYYSTGGGENPAFFFQQPPIYGMFDISGQTEENFRTVFPIAPVPDVQGGTRRVGDTGGLNAFTGCAGQGIFRGDRLPEDMRGDLFIPEPVGRLIRRAKVDRQNGVTVLKNATPGSEFMRSRDVNFRPLGSETAPDGTMFFIDMHRGIIQQGNWVREGSYLRGVVEKWGLDKNIGKGRIYRLVHRDFKPGPKPNMLDETTSQLVGHLSHPNGWWRDTAQKLIILRKDGASVIADLEKLAREGDAALGRVHALWTLEGLEAVDPKLIAEKIADPDPSVRMAAVRIAEPFLAEENETVLAAFAKLKSETDLDVVQQTVNSIGYSAVENDQLAALENSFFETHGDATIMKALAGNRQKLADQRVRLAAQRKRDAAFAAQMKQGAEIYKQLCFTCHGNDGKGMAMAGVTPQQTLAPTLVKSPRVLGTGGSLVRTVLHGQTGELDGKKYPGEMLPLGANNDEWIAAVTTYVRNSFGNQGGPITEKFVAAIRKQHADRKTPWTEAELEALEPPVLANRKDWKLTASHGGKKVGGCIDGNKKSRYDTGTSQVPGMWLQVELPEKSNINRIVLDSAGSNRDYPRGYEIRVSDDGKNWSEPVVEGAGDKPVTDISFPNAEGKFVKITQTGAVNGLFWSIHELNIFGKPVR